MKLIAWTLAGATLLFSLIYTVVSLVRWEWNRALFFLLVFVAAEVAVAAALVGKVSKLERGVGQLDPPRPDTLDTLRSHRRDHRRFDWLHVESTEQLTRSNVFITMVVGGGVVLSAGAWLIEKVAARTVDPAREESLARELDSIAYRPGLLVDEVTALARTEAHRDAPLLAALLRRRA